MKITKLVLAMALVIGAGPSYAGFVDNRSAEAVVEVNYKSISVEDLIADIVPPDVRIDYTRTDLRKKLVAIKGKGTWAQLLAQAASSSTLKISVDHQAKRITVIDRPAASEAAVPAKDSAAQLGASLPRAGAAVATSAVPPPLNGAIATEAAKAILVVKPAPPAVVEQAWDIKLTDKTIFGAMKRWSKTAGWQLMWDTEGNDFPVVAEATYRGGFDVAVGGVMASLQRSQFPLRACLYDNRAVRIIHKSKRCEG